MNRILDIIGALIGLVLFSPFLAIIIPLIWLQDFESPFYIAPRVSKGDSIFKMVKLRSMVVNADKSGVDSTGNNDMRITKVGKIVRKFKLDEIMQLWNVLINDMSLVGPRPNVKRETDLYTTEEKKILNVKPGITDFASIVFSDEGDILENKDNPDLAYNQLIRPWKNRLALFCIKNDSIVLRIRIILLTVTTIFNREAALKSVVKTLIKLNANEEIIKVSSRKNELVPTPPMGSGEVVLSRG
ncbi:MAG: sugar transferase [Bdellovibrionaceae bacterium]|jgi:lipopolysaccharide/colanic/teichoic acid biosynthesis glycosyltransferase|nr:sugar transferase [Pseudobdellovibrionaceae bacterium]